MCNSDDTAAAAFFNKLFNWLKMNELLNRSGLCKLIMNMSDKEYARYVHNIRRSAGASRTMASQNKQSE